MFAGKWNSLFCTLKPSVRLISPCFLHKGKSLLDIWSPRIPSKTVRNSYVLAHKKLNFFAGGHESQRSKVRHKVQSNHVNTYTQGTIESPYFMLFLSQKHHLLEQNCKEIKEHISIVKLKISNLHKAVIPRTKFTRETLKTLSFIYYLFKPFSA